MIDRDTLVAVLTQGPIPWDVMHEHNMRIWGRYFVEEYRVHRKDDASEQELMDAITAQRIEWEGLARAEAQAAYELGEKFDMRDWMKAKGLRR